MIMKSILNKLCRFSFYIIPILTATETVFVPVIGGPLKLSTRLAYKTYRPSFVQRNCIFCWLAVYFSFIAY